MYESPSGKKLLRTRLEDKGEMITCQSIDPYQACRTSNTDQMSVVLSYHSGEECFICLKQRNYEHVYKT